MMHKNLLVVYRAADAFFPRASTMSLHVSLLSNTIPMYSGLGHLLQRCINRIYVSSYAFSQYPIDIYKGR